MIQPTIEQLSGGVVAATWLLPSDSCGEPVEMPAAADRTVTVDGDLMLSRVAIVGGVTPDHLHPLHDIHGNKAIISSPCNMTLDEATRLVAPTRTMSPDDSIVTVTILFRRDS